MKKHLSLFCVFAVLILSLTGCGGTKTEDTEDTTQATESTTAFANTVGLNQAGVYAEGNTEVTVLNVQKNPGNNYDKPKNGYEYVVITVQVKNIGQEELHLYPFDFKLQIGTNVKVQPFTVVNDATALSRTVLAANESIEGTLIYQAPKDAEDMYLLYYGSLIPNPTIVFDLLQ